MSDAVKSALIAAGYSGSLNDMALKYYKAGGAVSNQLNQAEYEYLKSQGFVGSTLGDLRKNTGYDGNPFWAALMAGGPVTPVGGMQSLVVADPTPIDPQASIGASGSGWVAIVTLKGITSLVGTVVASDLTLTVSDPGYDTSGNVTTVIRTIKGVEHIRRQYPNGNSKMISTDGVNVTMMVSLDDWVYSGSTIVAASIGGSFYPACVAGTAGSKTNLSTTDYPKALFSWITPQQERAVAATHPIEAIAFHRHARAGQQVACIKYEATDGVLTGSSSIVGVTTVSSKITQGYPPDVWAADVDVSSLAAATLCTVNAKVYPWIGDASAVLDLSVDGAAWPTGLPITKLRLFNDRTGSYGGGYAYVKVGAAGGTVSGVAATAAASPFPTLSAALTALRAWNLANKSHNDLGGGTVRLMDADGASVTHTVATAGVNAPGLCWCEVEKDPAAVGAVSITWSVQSQMPSLLRWRGGLVIAPSVQTYNVLGYNQVGGMVCFDGITVDNTANKVLCGWIQIKYAYNVSVIGNNISYIGLAGAKADVAICAGMVGTFAAGLLRNTDQPHVMVGCHLPAFSVKHNTSTSVTNDGDHGKIIHNNRLLNAYFNYGTAGTTINWGLANVQNLYEHDGSDGQVMSMNYFADSDLISISNYIEMHNTAVGNRASRMYNDVAASKVVPSGVQKLGVSKYSIWDNFNCKTEVFNLGEGCVGNWAYQYSVGNAGNVSLFGAVQRIADVLPTNNNVDNYLGNAWLPSSEPNLYRTAYGTTQASIMAMFTNYTVGPQAVPAIGGNYVPLSTSVQLKNRVPIGMSVLKKDLAGTTRRTDGTGACGAYESA